MLNAIVRSCLVVTLLALGVPLRAQALGTITFPHSGETGAQAGFLEG